MNQLAADDGEGTAHWSARRCLRNIEERVSLNAVLARMPSAGAEAEGPDRAGESDDRQGLLGGMPILLKDNIDTVAMPTTCGSDFLRDHIPKQDATLVRRLRKHGSVLLGKTNLDEFAFGPFGTNPHCGDVVNPWNPAYVVGGSSSGSAAAVAADLCVGAFGTDSGGSIRVPAAVCGIAGLRPTLGLVPNRGVTPVSPLLDTVGPMSRRVSDLSRMLTAVAGPDPDDPTSRRSPCGHTAEPPADVLRGLRVGIPETFFLEDLDGEWAASTEAVARCLESLGAELAPCELSGARDCQYAVTTLLHADAASFHAERLELAPGRFAPQLLARLLHGTELRAVDYASALAWRREWSLRIRRTFRAHDVLLTPTLPGRPPRAEAARLVGSSSDLTRFTYAASLAGVPALALPCGFDQAGLPLSAQLLGPRWSDHLLLAVGRAYQRVTGWHLEVPPQYVEKYGDHEAVDKG